MSRIDKVIEEAKEVSEEMLPQVSKYNGGDWRGFHVYFTYPGDSVSDFESSVIVKADTEMDARNRMKMASRLNFSNFGYDPSKGHITRFDRVPSIIDFKKKFPHSNIVVMA